METFPKDLRGLIAFANVQRSEGDRPAALATYRQALRREPDNPLALWWKAEFHLAEPSVSELGQAQQALKKIVHIYQRKRDDTSREWTVRAQAKLRYCESRKFSLESHRYLSPKRGKAPKDPELKKARDLLTKALKAFDEDPRNHMNLGSVEFRLKRYAQAIAHCQNAIQLDSAYARAYLVLGHCYRAQGKLRWAVDAFLECIEHDTDKRDTAEAWALRREIEQDLAKTRREFFHALSRRVSDTGPAPLDLRTFKSWLGLLEGDAIQHADLSRCDSGVYALQAYGERSKYFCRPGPEGLVIDREAV
jgi:tetratricopeptide (TPR) repeat protein